MALPRYSSKDVVVAWSGVTLEGFTPDSFVSFTRSEDYTDEEVGSDGQLLTSISPNQTGTCTINLQATSPSNWVLSAAAEGYVTGAPTTGDLTIVDPSGAVFAFLRGAYLKSAPEVTLGMTATGVSNSWTFFCEQLVYTGSPSGLSAEALARVTSAIGSIVGS